MRPLVLIGIKHCGKSTLGKLLARRFNCPFIDSDDELVKTFSAETGSCCNIREIYRILGEEKFRELEAEVIRAMRSPRFRIIALGGGAAANSFLTEQDLKSLGKIIWLDTCDAVAYKRVLRNGLPPFLAEAEDPEKLFTVINARRRKDFARIADVTIPIGEEKDKREVISRLAAILESIEE